MSNSLPPLGLQWARLLSPPLSPRVFADSCSLNQGCHLTISSSAAPFSSCLQSFPASGSFPIVSSLYQVTKILEHQSFNEYSGLISFRIDWFVFFEVQGILRSLLQHHNSKASVLQRSVFCMVQLSHLYTTTGKTIALTLWTFVCKVMSLPFNLLSRFAFPSEEQTSFNFTAAVTICSDFGAQENKICHCFHFCPFYLPWSDGTGCHDLSFFNAEFQASCFTLLFHPHQQPVVPLHFLQGVWLLNTLFPTTLSKHLLHSRQWFSNLSVCQNHLEWIHIVGHHLNGKFLSLGEA